MRFRIIISILMVVALSACGHDMNLLKPDIAKAQKFFGVTLKPNVHPTDPTKSTVQVKSKAQGWNRSSKKEGYVGFDFNESGWIFFGVKNEDMGNTCASDGGTADWVISRISLSATGDSGTEKGTNFGGSQPAWLQLAFPAVSLSTGTVYDESASGAAPGNTFKGVFNANATEEEVLVYYEVELRECAASPGDPGLTTDPVIGNRGRD